MNTQQPTVVGEEGDVLIEIRTTFAASAPAEACVSRLVADRLAACGQVDGPVRSTYRWNGVVESAEEWRCTLKTTPALVEPCVQAVVAAHPYDTPEVLVARVHATKRYAAWVRASVGEG